MRERGHKDVFPTITCHHYFSKFIIFITTVNFLWTLSFPSVGHAWSDPTEQLQTSCNRTRRIISNLTWGIISDGKANYTQDSYCEWLIIGEDNKLDLEEFLRLWKTDDVLFMGNCR